MDDLKKIGWIYKAWITLKSLDSFKKLGAQEAMALKKMKIRFFDRTRQDAGGTKRGCLGGHSVTIFIRTKRETIPGFTGSFC